MPISSAHPGTVFSLRFGCLLLLISSLIPGCSRSDAPTAKSDVPDSEPAENAPDVLENPIAKTPPAIPQTYEINAETLLAARLPAEQTGEGWVRLFDNQTLFGWQLTGSANWRVEDNRIVVDGGEKSFLVSTSSWNDFELELEFKADEGASSGVFLRTPLYPESSKTDCYNIRIANDDANYPTGSIALRKAVAELPAEATAADRWHRYKIRVEGNTVTVHLDDELACTYEDAAPLPAGHVSLLHDQGHVEFRDIRIRPLGLQSLLAEENLGQWKQYPEYEGEFKINEEGLLAITGGSGQLETRDSFADFAMLTRVRTNAPDLNSGVFFRCIPGEKMNGYECQISNATKDGNPLIPGDCGSGGIFRRQDARIVAADDGEWFDMLLIAKGPTITAWVNGIQVSDWTDTREADPNPRRGLRLEEGTMMLQAHDPTTDLSIQQFEVVEYE
ncbi:hypothetical protein FF011L_47530 [Roseimaritima multifibrata]|uniref:3-keto-alpha-glucoside-1,2-lyase/3-keto-2-hydroxy-glucal hydratase domain-containing protein n=1 Tax=Roseimaritima multifibrata TaxID=1930274 RepID=A0A517MM37_9BACT|nr:DUF1080 domain-containing protein [Roseimaritima multifibrata]QDS95951.1 hypothetical protein FF011L_47530 [Roseimaritima multifibrata]